MIGVMNEMNENEGKQRGLGQQLEVPVLIAVDNLQGEAYGLAVQEEVDRLVGKEINVGALYNVLERLEDKGLITTRREENPSPGRGGKRRVFYTITGEGAKALDAYWEQQRQTFSRWKRSGGQEPAFSLEMGSSLVLAPERIRGLQ